MTLLLFGILVSLAALAAVTFRLLLRSQRVERPDEAWVSGFDLSRYAPMRRLLDSRETQYLKQAGATDAFVRHMRTERRRIFRVYLRNLSRDVRKLHAAARYLVLEAEDGAPELASRLASARIRFTLALVNVRFGLLLHAWGIDGVDVSTLIGSAAHVMAGIRAAHPSRQIVTL